MQFTVLQNSVVRIFIALEMLSACHAAIGIDIQDIKSQLFGWDYNEWVNDERNDFHVHNNHDEIASNKLKRLSGDRNCDHCPVINKTFCPNIPQYLYCWQPVIAYHGGLRCPLARLMCGDGHLLINGTHGTTGERKLWDIQEVHKQVAESGYLYPYHGLSGCSACIKLPAADCSPFFDRSCSQPEIGYHDGDNCMQAKAWCIRSSLAVRGMLIKTGEFDVYYVNRPLNESAVLAVPTAPSNLYIMTINLECTPDRQWTAHIGVPPYEHEKMVVDALYCF